MSYEENSEFIKDIQLLLKKHGMTAITCGNKHKLIEDTKHLEGFHFFFTKGEKALSLRGGEGFVFPSSIVYKLRRTTDGPITLRMHKVKYSNTNNTEDDGN